MFLSDIKFLLYFLANVIISSCTMGLAFHFYLNRKLMKFPSIGFIMLFVWIWLLGEVLEYSLSGFRIKLIMNYIQYVGSNTIPLTFIVFCYKFRYGKPMFSRKRFWLLVLIPLFWTLLVFTNEGHHWLWSRPVIDIQGYWLLKEYTLLFYLMNGTLYAMTLCGIFLLIGSLKGQDYTSKQQAKALIAAAFVPAFINAIENLTGLIDIFFEIAPLSFSLVCLSVMLYIKRNYEGYTILAQQNIVDSLDDSLFLLDPEYRIIYANDTACGLLNTDLHNLLNQEIFSFLPAVLTEIITRERYGQSGTEDFTLSGSQYRLSLSTFLSEKGKTSILMFKDVSRIKQSEDRYRRLSDELEMRVRDRAVNLDAANDRLRHEISQRKQSEDELHHNLQEKEILIAEIHHRVKNNLQLVSSLLKLQRNTLDEKEKEIRDVFKNAISRIKAIAIIHEKLYQRREFETVEIRSYLQSLLDYLWGINRREDSNIMLKTEIEDLQVRLGTCILLGLIINEMVLNSFKHAFPDNPGNKSNTVTVSFRESGGRFDLTVRDNGRGFPEDILDNPQTGNLGLKIIRTLSNQLNAQLILRNDNGAVSRLTFG